MKLNRFILLFLFLLLLGCKKHDNKNKVIDGNFQDIITNSVDLIHKNITKKDSIFYVIIRYDTLIVMASERENILRPTYNIDKIGYFNYHNNKIIIAQPYKSKFDLVNKLQNLNSINNGLKPPYYDGNDYQKGLVYKIENKRNFILVDKGNLTKYFKHVPQYENPKPPAPTK